ncbi:unnamed protein product [Ambrosiozyma monospora]|uniref:Unnamed protein product n=1 Tax=Ambrosiozyma monospora TaxID=43982 RepID=A0ACB5TND1_AMBMO|nr:unnamed protein product [Ambrosiozyma monospora]
MTAFKTIILTLSTLWQTAYSHEPIEIGSDNSAQSPMAVNSNFFADSSFLDFNASLSLLRQEESQLYKQLNFPKYSSLPLSTEDIKINIDVDYYEEYERLKHEKWSSLLSESQSFALQSLEHLADEEDNSQAAFTLGQIYLFGNYTIPDDPEKSLHYFQKCVSLSVNAEAHYYLGFLYTTGLFGKLEVDQAFLPDMPTNSLKNNQLAL